MRREVIIQHDEDRAVMVTTRCRRRSPQAAVLLGVIVLLGALLLTAPGGTVLAQAKVGTTGAQFLELGVSARAMGMAEAFTSVSNDVSAIYYNPAGLTALLGREVMFSYVSLPADVGAGFVGFGFPLEAVGGVVGIGAYGLKSGKMIERTYGNGDYSGTGRSFVWEDLAVSVGYGRYLTDRFSIGVNVKYIGEMAHDYNANGWAADVGTSYNTGFRNFKIAMVITNFGPDLKFIEKAYPLPINFKFGASIDLLQGQDHQMTVSAEGSHPSDNLEKYNGGVEYTYKERFTLRAGGRFNYDEDGLTFGGGLKLPFGQDKEIRVDYAYQDFGILTQVHRFSMSISF
jgi:hypothetical protein